MIENGRAHELKEGMARAPLVDDCTYVEEQYVVVFATQAFNEAMQGFIWARQLEAQGFSLQSWSQSSVGQACEYGIGVSFLQTPSRKKGFEFDLYK